MSYIELICSPYRSDNVWKEFAGILQEDWEWSTSALKGCGIFYPIGLICVMFISLLKAILFVFEDLRKPKMKGNIYERKN